MEAVWTRAEAIHAVTSREYERFVRKTCRGVGRSERRFVREMVWGMVVGQSMTLSSIGRWIMDGTRRLLYRVKRLSRHLRTPWPRERIAQNHLSSVASLIGAETSLVIDTSDIRKDRGRAFEYLDYIRDGSRGEQARGYTFITVAAVLGTGQQMPLYMAPYSARHPEFESENVEVLRAVETVVAGIGTKGVWIGDRGFDNWWLFNELDQRQLCFLVCVYHPRVVLSEGKTEKLTAVGEQMALPHRMHMMRRRHVHGKTVKQKFDVRFGSVPVVLPEMWDAARGIHVTLRLHLIAVAGYDPSGARTLFLTNVPMDSADTLRAMVRRYSDRWSVEEGIQFMKQHFHLEDVRVRAWCAIEGLLQCCVLAFAFLAWYLQHVQSHHKRLLPVLCSTEADLDPDAHFLYYRVHTAVVLACSFVQALQFAKPHG
jgi:hypothetical protein